MKKFFVLYMATGADFKKVMKEMTTMTEAERKQGMKEWAAWSKGKGIVDMGQPLGKNMRVKAKSITNSKNEIGGYSIIKAKSHEEAAKMMQSNPHFRMIPKGWIEVMEIMAM